MPDIFDPTTSLIGRLGRLTVNSFKDGAIPRLPVLGGGGNGPKEVVFKLEGYPEDSFEIVASTYRALTRNFPRTRLIKKTDKGTLGHLRDCVSKGADVTKMGIEKRDGVDYEEEIQVGIFDFVFDYQTGLEETGEVSSYSAYIMEMVDDVHSVEELIERRDRRLRHPRDYPLLFQDLGKIFVLDLFFANNDRIIRANPARDPLIVKWDESGTWCPRIQNIFLQTKEDYVTGTFNGIDFLPQNCPFTDLHESFSEQQATARREFPSLNVWPGKYLKKSFGSWGATRDRIARESIAFINRKLLEKGAGVQYGDAHRRALSTGLDEGRQNLREHLVGLKNRARGGPPLPRGLLSRMREFGW